MKKREFLVDITISLPKGLNQDDWSYVGHLYLDYREGDRPDFVATEVFNTIKDWLDKHPKEHDCYENSIETEKGYFCSACGKSTNDMIQQLTKLSRERKVNERATDIVS